MSLLKSGGPLLDALQGTSNHTSALAQCVLLTAANLLQSPSYCFLWYSSFLFFLTQPKLTLYHDRYHPPQIITPVLTAWNPHLILQAITCIHCIVSMYTKPSTSPRRLYAAGKPITPPHASHWLMTRTRRRALCLVAHHCSCHGLRLGRGGSAAAVDMGDMPHALYRGGPLHLRAGPPPYFLQQRMHDHGASQETRHQDLLWNLVFQLQMVLL